MIKLNKPTTISKMLPQSIILCVFLTQHLAHAYHHWNNKHVSSLSATSSVDAQAAALFANSYNEQAYHNVRHGRDHVKLFTCGKNYYRTFHLDAENDVLYVGAMDRIYKLNLSNVNRTLCEADSIYLEPQNSKNCISKGKSEHYECRNHIRVIQRIENGKRLYVCGTNANSPKDWILNPNLSELGPDETYPGIGNGIGKCPFDPEDNSTAVWVEHGNPGDLPALYSGSVAEFTRADSVVFRTNLYNFTDGKELYPFLRTVKYDSKWLDKPHFVGSFDLGEYVYFFFRESAVEYINCGKNIFSRVARVCKKDIGGKNILAKNWASFLKARLNCSIPGEFPFYFNEIQHVTQFPNDPNTFYGVFSTSNNGLTGSAVCSFTLDTIEKVFLGKFKEQSSSSSQWLPVLTSKVPTPRPGSCQHNTQQLPDSVLNFIRSHPLMDEAVANQGSINDQYHQTVPETNAQYSSYFGSNSDFYANNENNYASNDQQSNNAANNNANNNFPIFYRKDLIFSKIAVDYVDVDGVKYKLFYIGTNCGKLIKLVQWIKPNGAARSFVLDIIDVFTYNMPGAVTGSSSNQALPNVLPEARNIRAIEISSKHRSIYVATDHFVKQISLLNCKQRYSSCVQCVRDPHCGWDQNAQECKPYSSGLLQDVTNVAPTICDQCAKQYSKQVNVGESLHLPCNIPVHLLNGQQSINSAQQSISWHFTAASGETTTELKLTGNTLASLHLRQRFVQTSDGGLVILGSTTKEHGFFECRLSNKPLFRYQITVDTSKFFI